MSSFSRRGPAGGRTRSSALTRAACCQNTSRPSISSPGRIRTSDLCDVSTTGTPGCPTGLRQSDRQESNLHRTAHQTVASPLGLGPIPGRPYGGRFRRFPFPCRAVPAGFEPATAWLTASRTTVVLRDSTSERTEQESNLNESDAHPSQGVHDEGVGPEASPVRSSGGWDRTSGLRVFSAALSPTERHRKMSKTPTGVEPA